MFLIIASIKWGWQRQASLSSVQYSNCKSSD